ncbi:nucleolar protein 9-like [Zophobas morio]|uniref:nucleolar protein 9-like n=1 Tax=Zophobas morio TaxID=2755281 RepID=UPI003083EDAC
METVFSTVSHTTYRSLYLNVFRNHLLEYSLHPVGNYVVQHFMRNLEDSVLKEQVVGELVNTIEDILAVGHFGVVDALTAVTIGLSEIYQKKVVNSLLKAFHLQESSKFKYTVPCVLRLLTFEMYSSEDGSTETTTYFGASILMNAFKLQQNAVEPLIQSLLTMEPDEILALCKDPHGSFVMEAFLTSRIDLPRKKKIYKRVKNQLARLAMDKYGSRVLEAIWASADIAFKEFIADSLLGEEQQISSNMYGKIVMKKCNIDFYKRKKTAWLEKQEANQKKQELFKDILEETPDSSDSKLVQNKRKRAETPLADEIDKLFTSKRKTRNSAVSQRSTSQNPKIKEEDLALREELSSVDPFALDMKLTIKNIKKKNKKLKREKPSKKFIMS